MSKPLLVALVLLLLLVQASLAAGPDETRFSLAPSGPGPASLAGSSAQLKTELDCATAVLPSDIGTLIDQARYSPAAGDSWPVVLLLLAAEQGAGISSPLVTATQLLAEATAKARNNASTADLLVAAHIYGMLGNTALSDALAAESQMAAAASCATKSGPYTCDIIVNNYCDEAVHMWCNGTYVTTIPATSYYYETEVPLGAYYLAFHGADSGNLLGGPFDWTEPYQTYTVDLSPGG